MTNPANATYWKNVKRLSKLRRKARKAYAHKRLPLIKEFCQKHDIEIRRLEHGFQFRLSEYIINWSPTSNRVQVQYSIPGHDQTVPFSGEEVPGKLKIMCALEEAVQLVRECNGTARV